MTKVKETAPISSATIWRWTPLTALGFLIAGRALFSITPNPFVTVAPLIALAGGVALIARFVRPLRGGWMDATALSIAFANAGAWLAWTTLSVLTDPDQSKKPEVAIAMGFFALALLSIGCSVFTAVILSLVARRRERERRACMIDE